MSVVLCLLLAASAAHAAGTEHVGRVTLGGVPVPGARVIASQGDQRLTASTASDGSYRISIPADGMWTFRVEMLGFAPLIKEVPIGAGMAPTIWELTVLPFAEITRGVTIPPPPPVGTAAAQSSASSRPRQPARSRGQPASTASAPNDGSFQRAGVTPAAAGAQAGASPPGTAAAPPRPPAPAGEPGAGPQASGDSFVVSGSTNSGAVAQPSLGNVRRATGINLYSGQVTMRGSTSALDATQYSLTGVPIEKPDTSNFSINGSFGGPFRIPGLMRNQKNFSFNFSRTSNKSANTVSELMPTLLQRGGDFSQTVDGFGNPVQIIDPRTGLPFPGNVIPADRISLQAATLLQYYPMPDEGASGAYNYQIAPVSVGNSQQYGGSLSNLVSTTTNQVGVSGSYSRNGNDSTSLFGFDSTNAGSGFNTSANWTHRFLPSNLQIRFNYSFSRQTSTGLPFFAFRTNVSGEAGITGNNQSPSNWGPPSLSFSKSSIAGLSDGIYSFNRTQTHSFGAQTSRTRGRHNLQIGGNGRFNLLDIVSQQNPRGSFTFNGALTGHDFADFLLGFPNTSAIATGNADKGYLIRGFDAFLTDDFRVGPNLTITMGVRYEFEMPVSEREGRLVNLDVADDFSAAAPVVAADGTGIVTGREYTNALINTDPWGIQPRFGIAWRPIPTSSVVLRAGYGIYRNTGVYQAMATSMAQQPPLSQAFNATSTLQTPLTMADGFIEPVSTTINTVAIDPDFRVGVVHRWQASAQRDLVGGLAVVGTYSAARGFRLPQSFIPNTYPTGAVNPCPACPNSFIYTTSGGHSMMHSGQVQLRRRQRAGLTWQTSYTLMKATDNASSFSGQGQAAQDWLNLDAEEGTSSSEQRHQFAAQATYITGQGVSGGSLLTGLKGTLVKGWSISTNLNTGSGAWRTPTYRVTSVAGVTGTVRPMLTGEAIDDAPEGAYANPAAFAAPAPGTWGNAPRNSIRGPAPFTLNMNVGRSFTVRDRAALILQVQVTNLLNLVTYSGINTAVGSPQFGLPTSVNQMRRFTSSLSLQF